MADTNEIKVIFTLFGATGDLAKRKLYPAIFNLFSKGYLREKFAILGTSRQEMSEQEFRDFVSDSLEEFKGLDDKDDQLKDFVEHFYYMAHDVTDKDAYEPMKAMIEKLDQQYDAENNRIFYMSVAPRFFGMIGQSIKSEGLLGVNGFNRLMIEKPFGSNLDTARELQTQLTEGFQEEQIFRIDHYLAKEMVLNIAPLRFGNPFFEKTWNHEYIKNIQVTLSETLGVEARADYYETAGALLDMIQNHTMQIVGWLAMSKPESFDAKDIRVAKNKAFDSLRIYKTEQEVSDNFVRGQYVARKSSELSYSQEQGVAEGSQTNTFIAGKLMFDNERWEGVPFYIRSGKKLKEKTTRVDVVFKPGTFAFDKDKNSAEQVLTLVIDPYGSIKIQLNSKAITNEFDLRVIGLNWMASEEDKKNSPEPYERMIFDAMKGNGTNFADWQGVEISWKFIDEIAKIYTKGDVPLELYKTNSMGPKAADELLEKNGDHWIFNP